MAEKLYYKIGEACRVLDIQPYVLRYWETEFRALSPNKSKSGQRVYNERDLQLIQRIKELLYDEGYTIAGAKKKLEGEQASGRKLRPVSKTGPKPEARPKADKEPPTAAKTAAVKKPTAKGPAKPTSPGRTEPAGRPAAKRVVRSRRMPEPDAATVERLRLMTKAVRKALAEARELQKLLDSSR